MLVTISRVERLRNCDVVPRNCDVVPRNCDVVPRNCDVVPRNCDVVPSRIITLTSICMHHICFHVYGIPRM